MITLTVLLIIALLCVLVGCVTGLISLVGFFASLAVGVLIGALALAILVIPIVELVKLCQRRAAARKARK